MSDEWFEGWEGRECGDHRPVGEKPGYRAWCFDCREWCYPEAPCEGCEPEGYVPTHGVFLGIVYPLDSQSQPEMT